MAKVFVSNTMASCTGFLFEAEGSELEVGLLFRAAESYNGQSAWRERGCDGTVEMHEAKDDVVAFWNDRTESDEDFEGVCDMLREDGDVIRCGAVDLADYLLSLDRQRENRFPATL